jgi:hypothetical protein
VTAPWKSATTYPDAPHQYLLRHEHPDIFVWFQDKIKTEGVREQFRLRERTSTYRYFYAGDFKHWIIGPVLNRARVMPPLAKSIREGKPMRKQAGYVYRRGSWWMLRYRDTTIENGIEVRKQIARQLESVHPDHERLKRPPADVVTLRRTGCGKM